MKKSAYCVDPGLPPSRVLKSIVIAIPFWIASISPALTPEYQEFREGMPIEVSGLAARVVLAKVTRLHSLHVIATPLVRLLLNVGIAAA